MSYVSHMRATGYNNVEQPIIEFDGQHIAIHGRHLIVDGAKIPVAFYDDVTRTWLTGTFPDYIEFERICFTYINEFKHELPNN